MRANYQKLGTNDDFSTEIKKEEVATAEVSVDVTTVNCCALEISKVINDGVVTAGDILNMKVANDFILIGHNNGTVISKQILQLCSVKAANELISVRQNSDAVKDVTWEYNKSASIQNIVRMDTGT